MARSLTGLDSARADTLRESLLAHDRLAVLRSIHGLDTPFARHLRLALEDKALKLVLRSLAGLTTDEAFALRERGAPLTKESLDSLDGHTLSAHVPLPFTARQTGAAAWR